MSRVCSRGLALGRLASDLRAYRVLRRDAMALGDVVHGRWLALANDTVLNDTVLNGTVLNGTLGPNGTAAPGALRL